MDTALDLAKVVRSRLAPHIPTLPSLETLEALFSTFFVASLHTEEGRKIVFHAVLIDPQDPDPKPPERLVRDRWGYVRLAHSLPLHSTNLTKLALATDPKASSLAVYPDADGALWIWGLIDQQHRFHRYISLESSSGPERPGILEVSVTGPGRITVRADYVPIAELRIDRISEPQNDVFWQSPVHGKLSAGINRFLRRVRSQVAPEVYDARDHWDLSLTHSWISTLQRLILRIRGFGHGGAIVITPDNAFNGLAIAYPIDYQRIALALDAASIASILHTDASDDIATMLEEGKSINPRRYLDETVNDTEARDAQSEMDGALWFAAVLSRVDGLVVLTSDLAVVGFGAEITLKEEPPKVCTITGRDGDDSPPVPLDWKRFGTRHRSMFRYCYAQPESVGVVISQDGNVRVCTTVDGQVLVWERPRLQYEEDDLASEDMS